MAPPAPHDCGVHRHRDGEPETAALRCRDGSSARHGKETATVRVVTADLMSRTRAGEGDAFRS